MYSLTKEALKEFDNPHEFERMCADILNGLGYRDVVLIAPGGGSDDGKDITFTTDSGGKGLACVTLRKDIAEKFKQDFAQRTPGEYEKYILFCNIALTASQKKDFTSHCLNTLQALFTPMDLESLRSLLDSVLTRIREQYLHIRDEQKEYSANIEPNTPPYIRHTILALDSAKDDERKNAIRRLAQTEHPAASKALIEALQHPAKDVRLYAALALTQNQSLQDQLIPVLLGAHSDEDGQAYRSAINALTEFGYKAAPSLLNALNEDDVYVRRNAIRVLGQIKTLDTEVVPSLIRALDDSDPEVRSYAARTLGQVKAVDAVPVLKLALLDRVGFVRREAILALGQIKMVDTVPELIDTLNDDDVNVWSVTTMTLNQFGNQAVPDLINALSSDNTTIRCRSAEIIGHIKSVEAVPRLMDALNDKDAVVRCAAIGALGQMGISEAATSFINALSDEDARVRSCAANVLGKLKITNGVPGLIGALNDRYVGVRMSAASSLGLLKDERAVQNLREALREEEEEVRGRAAWALGEIGSDSAIEAVSEALYDKEKIVSNTAIDVLRRIGTPKALKALKMHRPS